MKWLPLLAVSLTVLATVVLWRALASQDQTQIHRMVQMQADAIRAQLDHGVEARMLALQRMARRWAMRGQPPRAEWEEDARQYVEHYRGYRGIAWVQPSFRLGWLVNAAGRETAPSLGTVFAGAGREAARAARARQEAVFTPPAELPEGGSSFLAYVPIGTGEGFGGFLVGMFDTAELLEAILRDQLGRNQWEAAVRGNGTALYTSRSEAPEPSEWAHRGPLALYGVTWEMAVWPHPSYLARIRSPLSQATLMGGLLMALLLGAAVHLGQRARERERQVEAINRELERENEVRRQAEELAERHAAELQRSNTELQQFAYVASHDLQEPLRIISSYVQLLARRYQGKLDSDADEFIGFAVDGTRRMQHLINDLLSYSRVGTRTLALEPTDCNRVLEAVLADLQASIEESEAQVTHDALPVLEADALQLHHVLQNLIGNAIKYRGEAPPRIHVSTRRDEGQWLFSVRDNGIGIDPAQAERIFVIFQRLHGKGQYSGTGIGLAICKKVVESHGGRIWMEPAPEGGTIFYFTLPARGAAQC
ncbi:MAG: hypothetical protein GWO16_06085 [Gammaproteobacteria bacterium]|nr:hypothetical protein [Gammaproteobacteria bacterium]NIR97621.1 hypothetical protein [Gammaproteobacteria bacterium]NIT63271.1 hypothetical protein [Gammaproteobacteria bacterium]NIV20203.1 hypothetical protein [Gammaproteobacteria bacterium]NIY31851.1 hypothetical protein [Gammaproteobacteria bacterium]